MVIKEGAVKKVDCGRRKILMFSVRKYFYLIE